MAKTQTGSRPTGLTRGKAMLIAVLSIVLIGVLYAQYGKYATGSGGVETETAATPSSARPRHSEAITPPKEPSSDTDDTQAALREFDQTKWKQPELAKVVTYDPFALPAGFPKPPASDGLHVMADDGITPEEKSKQIADALAELRMQLDELKERGVHVIVGHKGQYVAMIGDRIVHVGDEIGNGYTVTEIDPKHGVSVDWKSPE